MRRGKFCHGQAEARREHGVTGLVEREVGAGQFRGTVCWCRPAWVLREYPQAVGYRALPRFGGVRPLKELPGFLLPTVGGQCQDRGLAAVEEAVPDAVVLLCADQRVGPAASPAASPAAVAEQDGSQPLGKRLPGAARRDERGDADSPPVDDSLALGDRAAS
jgi:hypothetical protein